MKPSNKCAKPGWMLGGVVAGLLATGAQAASPSPLAGAIGETRMLADLRLRSESVDQESFGEDASALTLRGRLGFETGKAWNTTLLAEGDFLWPLMTDYNSTVNGKTAYPVVADPEAYELNRLQLTNASLPGTTITLGRQRIALDDHRFVGNVGWRQNEQTFDALRVVNKTIPDVTIDVSYVNRVNRVFGPEGLDGANDGRFTGDTFLANVSWQLPVGKLTGFGYLVEFEQAPVPLRDSTQTVGLRLQGERPVSKFKLGYVASWATQQDRGDNPLEFSNDYLLAELTASFRQYSLGAGYELLEGDGVKGFATPLATLHKFQGWADKFLATPANGLSDTYVNAGYTRKGVGPFETVSLAASWHDYESDIASIDYGSEWDVQLSARFRRFTGTLKLADYSAATTTPAAVRDTRKLWAQVDYVW
ncbi:MAG TPA: hypothetical protein VNQ32_04520 [Steroidobacteraceae bacterium]|nr:hypothetical protein [Steroidobacteraceae bacterium]